MAFFSRKPPIISPKILEEIGHQASWAIAWRRTFEAEWDEAQSYYEGTQNQKHIPVQHPIILNKVWALVNIAIPQLWFRNPYAFVKPTRRFDMGDDLLMNAEAQEAVANRIWRSRAIMTGMRKTIQDAFLESCGWFKTGYSSEMGLPKEDELVARVMEMMNDPELNQIASDVFGSAEEAQEALLNMDDQGHLMEFDTNIQKGYAWSKHLSNRDAYPDPSCEELDESRFLMIHSRHLLRAVMKNPIFENKKGLVGEPDSVSETEPADGNPMLPDGVNTDGTIRRDDDTTGEDAVDKISLFEYWDKERLRVYTLCKQPSPNQEGSWRCIRNIPWPYTNLGVSYPVQTLKLNYVKKRFYPATVVAQWKDQQDSLNIHLSMKTDMASRQGTKIGVKEGSIQNQELQKLERPGPGIIKFSNGSPKDNYQALDHPTVSPDVYRGEHDARQDIDYMSGFLGSPNAGGTPNDNVLSATEIQAMQASVQSLADDALNKVSYFASDITRDHIMILKQFWSTDELVELTNPRVGSKWVQVTNESFRGEYDYVIEVGSTQKQSVELRQKRAVEIMNAVNNPVFAQLFGPQVVKQVYTRIFRAFSDFFDDPATIFEEAAPFALNQAGQPGPTSPNGMPGAIDNRQGGADATAATPAMGIGT